MKTPVDIDLRRFPPTPDDIAAGFTIARGGIAAAFHEAEERHGPTVLVSAYVMLGDILTSFGLREDELVELARQGARMQSARTH